MRPFRSLVIVTGVAVVSCARVGPGPAQRSPTIAGSCGRAAALPRELVGRLVILGDLHGSNELPEIAGDVACAQLATGREVRLGLEMSITEQGRLDAFLASDGSADARRALVAGDHWGTYDGRSSLAMFRLIDRVRVARQSGANIGLFAFDLDADSAPEQWKRRDETMAKNVAADVAAHPGAVHVVLAGNLHARTAQGSPWDPSYRPMGLWLRESGVQFKSLDVTAPAGEAWMMSGPKQWGVQSLGAYGPVLTAPFELFAAPSPEGYDGRFAAQAMTASRPMRESL